MALTIDRQAIIDLYEECQSELSDGSLSECDLILHDITRRGIEYKVSARLVDESVTCDWKGFSRRSPDPTCDYPVAYELELHYVHEMLRIRSCYLHWVNIDQHDKLSDVRDVWRTHGGSFMMIDQSVAALGGAK